MLVCTVIKMSLLVRVTFVAYPRACREEKEKKRPWWL